jgi:hypothetical protein
MIQLGRCYFDAIEWFFFFSVSLGVFMTITSQVLRWERVDLFNFFFFCF